MDTSALNVELWLSVQGHVFAVLTCLLADGTLRDTADGAVAAGFHSSTLCRFCGENLCDYEA